MSNESRLLDLLVAARNSEGDLDDEKTSRIVYDNRNVVFWERLIVAEERSPHKTNQQKGRRCSASC